MSTKIYTPEQARLIKQKAHKEALQEIEQIFQSAHNDRLTARRRNAEERREAKEDLKAMGLWEGEL